MDGYVRPPSVHVDKSLERIIADLNPMLRGDGSVTSVMRIDGRSTRSMDSFGDV
jgi:hypothetical protein